MATSIFWLSVQPFPADVRGLVHPFQGSSSLMNYRYMAFQAFAEMLEKKCDLENLVRLSVQRNLEDYLVTYCGMKDLGVAFKDWVLKKAKSSSVIQ